MSAAPAYLMHTSARQPVSFSRGQGASLWDTEGVKYLDAIAGVAVTSLGHANPEIAAAIAEQALRQLFDEHDWLMMIDEVQTGLGRTGTWFGFEHAGIKPDVITLAKALGNGFPIGACLARGKAAQLFSPGHHASTFGGNPLACRVGCTVLDIMLRDHIPQRVAASGRRLLAALKLALGNHPEVVSVRGIGLMIGIELNGPCAELVGRAREEQRLLITVTRGNTVRLLPPLICDDAQIDDIAARITRLLSPAA